LPVPVKQGFDSQANPQAMLQTRLRL
jgi:hypothetical protein